MKDGSVLGTATAVAAVEVERVHALLTAEDAPRLLGLESRSAGVTIGVAPASSCVWMHGEFWYQGEYVFEPHAGGTLVTYRIRNISGRSDALIRIWQRRLLRSQQADVESFAAALATRV